MLLLLAAMLVQDAPADAEYQYPLAVAVAPDETAYVVDRDLPGVWAVKGGERSVFHRASKTFRTPLNAPRCAAVDADGRVLVGDSATRDVYRLGADGKDAVPLTGGAIGIPAAIAVAGDRTLYVSDLETQRIWAVPGGGGEPAEFAVVAAVRGLGFDGDGRLLAVTTLADPVLRFETAGEDRGDRTVLVPGRPFRMPHHLAVAPDGTLFVADNYSGGVWRVPVSDDGYGDPVLFAAGDPLAAPVGLAWDGTGDTPRLLVADPRARGLFAVDPGSGAVRSAGLQPRPRAQREKGGVTPGFARDARGEG